MKTICLLLAIGGLAACATLRSGDTSAAHVNIVFVHPEKFTDVRDCYPSGTDKGREEYLRLLKEHIEDHLDKYIPDGEHLDLRITDIKMAGDFEPWRGPNYQDVRYIRDVYPPRIDLEFKLADADGKIVKEGKRTLTNEDFMEDISIYFPDDPLRYEKPLLDDWFRKEFGQAKS